MEILPEKYIKRISKNLDKYNITLEDFMLKFKYCGGDEGRHLNYYNLCYPGVKLQDHKDECICGHEIERNRYITDNNKIIVLGNCCIKRFVVSNTRTCDGCNKPHKNRKVNRCNDCRIGICDNCGNKCRPQYKTCYKCYKKVENIII